MKKPTFNPLNYPIRERRAQGPKLGYFGAKVFAALVLAAYGGILVVSILSIFKL